MAKLRRDMFDWFYAPHIEIPDYDPAGRDEIEDQETFGKKRIANAAPTGQALIESMPRRGENLK